MTALVLTRKIRRFFALLAPADHAPDASNAPGTPDAWLAGLRLGG